MSRYRQPRPKSSPYITAQGHQRLQDELAFLWKVKRPEVTAKVAEAAALGDRSENAEYIYGKKQLREIDSRIHYLSKRLDELEVIDRQPADQERVFFGAWVTLEDVQGEIDTLRIVGADEIDTRAKHISIDAPLARALVGKCLDDEVVVDTQLAETPRVYDPSAAVTSNTYTIIAIKYEN